MSQQLRGGPALPGDLNLVLSARVTEALSHLSLCSTGTCSPWPPLEPALTHIIKNIKYLKSTHIITAHTSPTHKAPKHW